MFDLGFDGVGQFVAVGAEQLDAVVLEHVVRGGDHHAEIGAQRARQHRDGRRRQRAELEHVHADRREARDERGFDHVAGEARVLADNHAMAVIAAREIAPRRHADAQGGFGGHRRRVRLAANAIGAEIFASSYRVPTRFFALRRSDTTNC